MSSKVLPEVVWRAFQSEEDTAFVFELEDIMTTLITTCSSKSFSKLSLEEKQRTFPAADAFKRQLVHRIAGRFGLDTESKGEGDARYVIVKYSTDAEIPETSLRDAFDTKSNPSAAAAGATASKATEAKGSGKPDLAAELTAGFTFAKSGGSSGGGGGGTSSDDAFVASVASMSLKPSYELSRPTYDHVVELRYVPPSTTVPDVLDFISRQIEVGSKIQDAIRCDATTMIVICANAEMAQRLLATFRHPVIRISQLSPVFMRVHADDIAPPIRPATDKSVANRLIHSALGGRSSIKRVQAELEAKRAAVPVAPEKPKPAASTGIDGDWRAAREPAAEPKVEVVLASTATPDPPGGRTLKGRGASKFESSRGRR